MQSNYYRIIGAGKVAGIKCQWYQEDESGSGIQGAVERSDHVGIV
jgi:hypothetical protein